MAKYLLACDCGQQLEVEPGQAGETLACACGRSVSVPTLRRLRELPVASEAPAEPTAGWGGRHRAITVLSLTAIVLLAGAGVSWWNQPAVPEFNPAGWNQMMDSRISELTPVAAWQLWQNTYEPLQATGFATLEYHGAAEIEREIGRRRWVQLGLTAVAAICLFAAAATAVAGRNRS